MKKAKLNGVITELIETMGLDSYHEKEIIKELSDLSNMNKLIIPIIANSTNLKLVENGNNIWEYTIAKVIEKTSVDLNQLYNIAKIDNLDFNLSNEELKIDVDDHILGLMLNLYGDFFSTRLGFEQIKVEKIIKIYDKDGDGIIKEKEINYFAFDLSRRNFDDIEVSEHQFTVAEVEELDYV